MSGSLVGGVVGAVVGYATGGLISPATGWLIGSTVGTLLDSRTKGGGPSLTDLRPQTSEYGRPIPIIYSVMAVGGNVFWASDLVQTSSGDAGGKGGGGDASSPTYAANFAVLIAESDGELELGRIWAGADKRMVRDAAGVVESGTLRFYNGAGNQMPDPLIESYLGAGNVPAYRGFAYIVWEGFDVSAHDGDHLPFLLIEVGRKGNLAPPELGTVWFNRMLDGGANWVIAYHGSFYGVLVYSKASMSLVHNWQIDENYQPFQSIIYDATHGVVLFANRNTTSGNMPLGLYFTVDLTTGVLVWHTPFTPAAGETLKDVLLSASEFVFIFALGTGGSKLYYVNTATHALSTTQTVDAGGSAASWAYTGPSGGFAFVVLADGTVARYDLDHSSTSSLTLGTMPTNFAGSVSGAVDPNSGHLWLASHGGSFFYWACYDSTSTLGSNSMPDPFFSFADQPWCFIPGSPNQAWFCGEVWLAKDQFIGFDSDAGALLGGGEAITGVYHGINSLNDVMWNDVTSQVQALRHNGYYATGGATPPTLPFITGPLGGADGSLTYQTLAEVVTDLSLRAGLTADDIDVTQLTDQVDGYTIANQMTVQDAIKALMPAYYFDAVESQGKIKFVKRGGAIAAEIPLEDLGAHPSSEDAEAKEPYHTTRLNDEELPRTLNVTYVLAATKYSPASKYARRLIGSSGDEETHAFSMVFTDTKGQEVADVNLHNKWVERLPYKFSIPREYGYLEPTDIVGIDGYTMRITKMNEKAGYYECEAVRDDTNVYTPNVIVTETPPPDETVVQQSLTLLELM